jgi:hypothetical protein
MSARVIFLMITGHKTVEKKLHYRLSLPEDPYSKPKESTLIVIGSSLVSALKNTLTPLLTIKYNIYHYSMKQWVVTQV